MCSVWHQILDQNDTETATLGFSFLVLWHSYAMRFRSSTWARNKTEARVVRRMVEEVDSCDELRFIRPTNYSSFLGERYKRPLDRSSRCRAIPDVKSWIRKEQLRWSSNLPVHDDQMNLALTDSQAIGTRKARQAGPILRRGTLGKHHYAP